MVFVQFALLMTILGVVKKHFARAGAIVLGAMALGFLVSVFVDFIDTVPFFLRALVTITLGSVLAHYVIFLYNMEMRDLGSVFVYILTMFMFLLVFVYYMANIFSKVLPFVTNFPPVASLFLALFCGWLAYENWYVKVFTGSQQTV